MAASPQLRLVRPPEPSGPQRTAGAAGAPAGGDLVLLAFVLAVCLVPIVGLLAGGAWGQGTAGLATAVGLLSGRALVRGLRERRRA